MLMISSARCLRYASTHRLLRSEHTCLRRTPPLTHHEPGTQSSAMPVAHSPHWQKARHARDGAASRAVQVLGVEHSHSHQLHHILHLSLVLVRPGLGTRG